MFRSASELLLASSGSSATSTSQGLVQRIPLATHQPHCYGYSRSPRLQCPGKPGTPQRCRTTSASAGNAQNLADLQGADVPWAFGFQCNERLLQWDSSAQRQLIRIYIAKKLDLQVEDVEVLLAELGTILPDMVDRFERTRADILLALVSDQAGLVQRMVLLRELMPNVNVSQLVSRYPALLLDYTEQQLRQEFDTLRRKLPQLRVDLLVEQEPRILKANMDNIMAELRRLMPAADHVAFIAANPTMVLDMETAGMPGSLEY